MLFALITFTVTFTVTSVRPSLRPSVRPSLPPSIHTYIWGCVYYIYNTYMCIYIYTYTYIYIMLHCKLRVLQRFTPYSIGMHESFATPFVPGVMVRLVLPICRRWLKLAPLGWPLHYSDFFNLPTSNNMHS